MDTLKDFNDAYIKKTLAFYKRQEKIRKHIGDLESKKQRMKYPSFEKILLPIIETIRERLEADSFEVMGPFGLGCETSIYWYKNKKIVGEITFTSNGNGWALKDYSKKINNSIGMASDGDFANILIGEIMDIEWLLKFVKQGF